MTQLSLLIITGYSGAGISSAMGILEDIGYSAFDNFPLSLLPNLLEQEYRNSHPIAVSFDTRAHNFDPSLLLKTIANLKAGHEWKVKTLFLSADDSVLLKRFSETRRTHPLARDRGVMDGISAEKSLLYSLKHEAGRVVDTSDYSIHDLRRFLEGFAGGFATARLNITVMSFSYRYGLPREADIVLDARFLRNPHWDETLRAKTGLDKSVQDYVREDAAYVPFFDNIKSMLDVLLPRYQSEGKSYLTIAIGCTGGKHRSVTVAEDIAQFLRRGKEILPVLHHRELK